MLESPVKTLIIAGVALVIGTAVVVAGLNMLNWVIG